MVGLDCSNAILTSAKMGIGIEDILEAVVQRIPAPPDNTQKPLRALIFDSYYDAYKARLPPCLTQLQCLILEGVTCHKWAGGSHRSGVQGKPARFRAW